MITDPIRVHEVSRKLRSRCEAIYGAMFVAPEYRGAHGLDTVQWYMAGRIAPLGEVSAEIACAVLGTFNPRRVHAGIDDVWSIVTAEEMISLKLDSVAPVLDRAIPTDVGVARAIALLGGALDATPLAGAPLFAALSVLPVPASDRLRLWRLCDMVREHRSDAHTNAWRATGLDPCEVNVLNEAWRDVPVGRISHDLMGWRTADTDVALEQLGAAGLVTNCVITAAGRELRESIERQTSVQQGQIVEALGDRAEELIAILDPWAHAVAGLS